MTFLRTIALVATLGLVGCVTTEVSGDASLVANPKEAAQINQELGIAYLRQGNYEQARTKLEKAVDDDPDLATAHSALGLVYERLGAIDEAEDEYRRAVRLAGKDSNTLNALAVFLCVQRNEPDDALRYFDRAFRVSAVPQSGHAVYERGCLRQKSRPANVRRLLSSSVGTGTDVQHGSSAIERCFVSARQLPAVTGISRAVHHDHRREPRRPLVRRSDKNGAWRCEGR